MRNRGSEKIGNEMSSPNWTTQAEEMQHVEGPIGKEGLVVEQAASRKLSLHQTAAWMIDARENRSGPASVGFLRRAEL